jgi:TonB family protein
MKSFSLTLLCLAGAVLSAFPQVARSEPADFIPPKIVKSILPDFPRSLYTVYRQGGSVSVVIALDEEGKLCDSLVISCSNRRFADLALNAIQAWRFEPARLRGVPVAVSIPINFEFEMKGVVFSAGSTESIDALLASMVGTADSYRLASMRELDRIPNPLHTVAPSYPKALAEKGTFGAVTVEFYIDENGAVRMPSVIGLPPKILADLAVDAVRQWSFETPTRSGRPALVRVRQTFSFNPDASKS